MCQHDQLPHGSALQHGEAHENHHKRWSRRHFIRNMGLGSGALLFGKVPIWASAGAALDSALGELQTDRILIWLRLKGGNDGLNMVIPIFDFGTYQSVRPNIHIPQNQTLDLNGEIAIPQVMQSAYDLWEKGQMKVVQNVGYATQNLSHFTSTDIWGSAQTDNNELVSGWMGRYLDGIYPGFIENPPEDPPAIQVGGAGSLFFRNEEEVNLGTVLNNPEQLAQIAQNGQAYDPIDVPDCYYGEQLSYLRTVANTTYQYAGVINKAYESGSNQVEYRSAFGSQLAIVARLIKGGLNTPFYIITLDGFDTHASQQQLHPLLLQTLAEAVQDFFADLTAGGQEQRVLAATFSEFGRRIEQNGSMGTDHGAAAPLMLFGPELAGNGVVGDNPDLDDLDPVGNLKFSTDFRQVYATLLENWLCVDPTTVNNVLGDNFTRIPELGISCSITSSRPEPRYFAELTHSYFYQDGQLVIQYDLPESLPVRVRLFAVNGKQLAMPLNNMQMAGKQQLSWNIPLGWPTGLFIYTIEAGPYRASGKAIIHR